MCLKTIVLLITLMVTPIYGWGSDDYCFKKVRQEVLNRGLALPLGVKNALPNGSPPLATWAVEGEAFSRTMGEDWSTLRSLNYEYLYVNEDASVKVEARFKTAPPDSSHLFILEMAYVVSNGEQPVWGEAVSHTFSGQCENKLIKQIIEIFSRDKKGNQWVERIVRKNGTENRVKKKIDPNELEFFEYFQMMWQMARANGEVDEIKELRRFNPWTQKIETLEGSELGDHGHSRIDFSSNETDFSVTVHKVNGHVNSVDESLPAEIWQSERLKGASYVRHAQVFGFLNRDFTARELRYQMEGSGTPLRLFNETQYFSILRRDPIANAWQMEIEVKDKKVPTSVSWMTPVAPADRRYLQGSRRLQLDKVSHLVQIVRKRLAAKNGATRLDAAQIITEEIGRVLTYDFDMVNNGLVDVRSVQDVLAAKKGVCQHFAAVFVAVARALKIPARIVGGYLMLADGYLGGHAWVEVKINSRDWWPLEPQRAGGRALAGRNYIPVEEWRAYEAESDSERGRYKSFLDEVGLHKAWQNIRITKLSASDD